MDPDQLASEKPANLDLCCFLKRDISAFSMVMVNLFVHSILPFSPNKLVDLKEGLDGGDQNH